MEIRRSGITFKQSVQVTTGVTTTTGGGAGSVILPPVMGTSTFARPWLVKPAAVSNVALIVVGALVNALFGTNGAVPFVVPTNINVVSGEFFPLLKISSPTTCEICDATTLNKPLGWPGVVVEMLPLNSLTLTAPRGVSSVVFTINELG